MPTIFKDQVQVDNFSFNTRVPVDGARFHVDTLDGWDDSPEPTVVVGQFMYSDGVVTADRFPLKEKYIEVGGWVHTTSRLEAEQAKQKLRAMFNPGKDIFLVRRGPIPQGYWVRPSTKLEFPVDIGREGFRWLVQVMAEWPFRLGVDAKTGLARPFVGSGFYRLYEYGPKFGTRRRYKYDADSNRYYRTYYQDVEGQGGDTVATVMRTNYSADPQATASSPDTLWAFSPAGGSTVNQTVITNATDGPTPDIKSYRRATIVGDQTSGSAGPYHQQTIPAGNAGDQGSVGMWVRPSRTTQVAIYYRFMNGTSTVVGQVALNRTLQAGVWTRLDSLVTATGAYTALRVWVVTTAAVDPLQDSDQWDWTGGLVEMNPTPDNTYFDGNTPGTASLQYVWVTPPGPSASQLIQYTKVPDLNPIPDTIIINNDGDANAYGIFEVTGPLPASTWYIQNDTTSETMSFDSPIAEGQTLRIDTLEQTAKIGEAPVDYYMRGGWITLVPGLNQIRLVSTAEAEGATLRITAYDTWR